MAGNSPNEHTLEGMPWGTRHGTPRMNHSAVWDRQRKGIGATHPSAFFKPAQSVGFGLFRPSCLVQIRSEKVMVQIGDRRHRFDYGHFRDSQIGLPSLK